MPIKFDDTLTEEFIRIIERRDWHSKLQICVSVPQELEPVRIILKQLVAELGDIHSGFPRALDDFCYRGFLDIKLHTMLLRKYRRKLSHLLDLIELCFRLGPLENFFQRSFRIRDQLKVYIQPPNTRSRQLELEISKQPLADGY